MNPTPKLRFVERQTEATYYAANGLLVPQTIRVLQQWYAYDIEYPMTKGEWKDVPLEKEHE